MGDEAVVGGVGRRSAQGPAEFIGRFEVKIDETRTFELHDDVIGVGCRDPRVVEFYTVIRPGKPTWPRRFTVVGTGHPLPPNWQQVWGPAYFTNGTDGSTVGAWHLVEIKPSPLDDPS